TGSMIDTFDFLRDEIKTSVGRLAPSQKFAVIMFSEKVDAVFPKPAAGGTLAAAATGPATAEADPGLAASTPENKLEFVHFMNNLRAEGKNAGKDEPFTDAFKKAFALKAQTIHFLTDNSFDPKLLDTIKELNKAAGGKVRINTIAFIHVSK